MMMLIPASIQACEPGVLYYFPDNVVMADSDLDQPQFLAVKVAAEVGMEVLDLRDAFESVPGCLLAETHELVARTVVGYLARR
ncbi:MAG: hypothetical protein GY926_14660 [bacterium]|nr:hypothetical protein [bacterium]